MVGREGGRKEGGKEGEEVEVVQSSTNNCQQWI